MVINAESKDMWFKTSIASLLFVIVPYSELHPPSIVYITWLGGTILSRSCDYIIQGEPTRAP
jgi:hypothetical protein